MEIARRPAYARGCPATESTSARSRANTVLATARAATVPPDQLRSEGICIAVNAALRDAELAPSDIQHIALAAPTAAVWWNRDRMGLQFLARLSRFGVYSLCGHGRDRRCGILHSAAEAARRSVRFYRALFPERSVLHALVCAWRQYQDFASLYYERLEIERRSDVRFERDGEQRITEARAAGRGAILIMSHFGRWEIGARVFAKWQEGMTLSWVGRGRRHSRRR